MNDDSPLRLAVCPKTVELAQMITTEVIAASLTIVRMAPFR